MFNPYYRYSPTPKITKPYAGPQPACCSNKNYLKFIRTHGCNASPINGKNKTYTLPKNVYVITMSSPGESVLVSSVIKDDIFQLYRGDKTLFNSDDKGSTLTPSANSLLKKYKSVKLLNHKPTMKMNDIYINFGDVQCNTTEPDATCKLFCFNKNKPHDEIECSPNLFDVNTGTHKKVTGIYLSEFIDMQGPGTYIVSVCREFSTRDQRLQKAARELSDENMGK